MNAGRNSVAAPAGGRRRGPWFDILAMLAIGVVIVGAALVPAFTANTGGTTTIRGDVTSAGRPLPFFPVGFWTTTQGVVSATQTDANGGFTLDVPSTSDGFAFAGTAPDAQQAIIAIDGAEYVRGIIGAKAATPVSAPVYQGYETAIGSSLAQRADQLHFLLQQPGRLSGVSPVRGAALRSVQVRRLDGSVVQTLPVDGQGRFTSRPLVPGGYAVALLPASPALAVAVQATVAAGAVTPVTLPTPEQGATLLGTVTSVGSVTLSGIPVLLSRAGVVIAATTTDTSGQYRIAGLAAGDYGVEVGRFAQTGSTVPAAPATQAVPIPGVTATPTPSPTASPTPTATTGPEAALRPVAHTADAVLPSTGTVSVPSSLGEVSTTSTVPVAGRVAGTVQGGDGSEVQVVAEDPTTGQILRSATASPTGAYTLGGLDPGMQYVIAAVSAPADASLARSGTTTALATTSTTGVDVVLDSPAASLTGTVTGLAAKATGTVTVGDASVFARTAAIDSSGAYTVLGLVPGAYPASVSTAQHLRSTPVAVTVRGATDADLTQGPSPATFKGWFISGGAGVPRISGTATDAAGDVIRLGPETDAGHVTVTGLTPGTYAYDAGSFLSTAPTTDGPWWFDAPTGSFTLVDGAVKDVGPVVLHSRSR